MWGTPNGERLKVTKTLANGSKQDEESDGFFLSGDKNFRPTDAIFGEDGALYVSDWQSVIIGHMQHNVRDPNRDKARTHLPRKLHAEASPEKSRDPRCKPLRNCSRTSNTRSTVSVIAPGLN